MLLRGAQKTPGAAASAPLHVAASSLAGCERPRVYITPGYPKAQTSVSFKFLVLWWIIWCEILVPVINIQMIIYTKLKKKKEKKTHYLVKYTFVNNI